MLKRVNILRQEVEAFTPKSEKEVDIFRLKYLGKKGEINTLFNIFKTVEKEDKKEYGQAINELKKNVQEKIILVKKRFKTVNSVQKIDTTKPIGLDSL